MEQPQENFEFKALTGGLGFSSKPEKSKLKQAPSSQSSSHSKARMSPYLQSTPKSEKMGDLSAFYSSVGQQNSLVHQTLTKEEVEPLMVEKLASPSQRSLAFLIDFSIVALITTLFNFLSLQLIGLNWKDLYPQILTSALGQNFIFSVFLIFISYFSIAEKFTATTPGKYFFKLKVKGIDGRNIVYSQSLLRSLISMMGLLILCIPNIFDLQSKLTETKVIVES